MIFFKKEALKIYRGILKLYISRTILRRKPIDRNITKVDDEYNKKWTKTFNLKSTKKSLRPQEYGGKLIWCRPADHRKFFLEHMQRTLFSVQPESLLEMGSGDGINLFAIAILNPQIKKLTGVELTDSGVESSLNYIKNPPIDRLLYLTGKSTSEIITRLNNCEINFIKGDITKLKLPDKSFDLSFTMWVLEQIPKDYGKVFFEAGRVSKNYALFYEAFKEAQDNFLQIMHLKNQDYFHASFHEAEKYGLETLKFEPMEMSKIKFRSGALLCRTKV